MKTAAYRYKAKLARTIDGDTCHISIDLGFNCHLTVPLRIVGVNTPERGEAGYKEAKLFLERLLTDKTLIVETHKTKGGDEMSFARYVAEVWVDGKGVAKQVIDAGHGQPFQP